MARSNDVWDEYGWDLRLDDDQELIQVDFECLKTSTELAALVVVDGFEHWIPRGQIAIINKASDSMFDSSGTLSIPEWLAEAKGL